MGCIKLKTMEGMFDDTDPNSGSDHIFDQPIGSWTTSSVTNMSNMFKDPNLTNL